MTIDRYRRAVQCLPLGLPVEALAPRELAYQDGLALLPALAARQPWERLGAVLRERLRQGRNLQPRGCISDSQSIKTTSGGGIRGYNGAKRLSGRKRHLLVDTLCLLLKAQAHATNSQERTAAPHVLAGATDLFRRSARTWSATPSQPP